MLFRRKTTSKGIGNREQICNRGIRSVCWRKQRFSLFPGPRRPERRPSTGRVRCHYSPLLSYGPRRRPARHSPCRGSPSPARRQGWAQRARGGGGAGVREPERETCPKRNWGQGRQPGALHSPALTTSPPSTWRGEGRQWGGGPRPAARTPPAVLGPSSGGTAAPRPLRDAIPRPDSRPSALAATEQQRLPLGAAVAAASSCSSFSGAAAYTHTAAAPHAVA